MRQSKLLNFSPEERKNFSLHYPYQNEIKMMKKTQFYLNSRTFLIIFK